MKKTVSKFVMLVCALCLLFAFPTSADSESTATVFVRIEGISQNLYCGEVTVPYQETLTAGDVLDYVDQHSDSLTITGIKDGYISAVNNDVAGKFGGWEGWLYEVDGVSPAVGVNEYEVKDGSEILLYYGDPYGVGFQFPVADLSELDKGIIRFTSEDTVYDEEFNPSVSVNPVVGAKVMFGDSEYVTDSNGEIKIDEKDLTNGEHSLSISKYDDNGLPLILRLEPGYTVNVQRKTEDAPSSALPVEKEPNGQKENPKTADHSMPVTALLFGFASLSAIAFSAKKNEEN